MYEGSAEAAGMLFRQGPLGWGFHTGRHPVDHLLGLLYGVPPPLPYYDNIYICRYRYRKT